MRRERLPRRAARRRLVARLQFAGLLLGLVLIAVVIGRSCGPETPAALEAPAATSPEPLDAGQPQAEQTTAGAGSVQASSGRLRLQVVARAVTDSGTRELDAPGPTPELPIDARFEVDLPALVDVRVRLFDGAERAVGSRDRAEFGTRTHYSLVPTEPLVPGSDYFLVIDGLLHEFATDSQGRKYEPVRFALHTAGERPKAVTKPAPKRKSSKRGR